MSPREPRRTTRKRRSVMPASANGVDESAGGMVFGIADDCYTDSQPFRDGALWYRIDGVIGAFGVNVRAKIVEQLLNVGLAEKDYIVDRTDRSHQLRAGRLR